MTKAWTETPPESKILDTAEMEEIWGPSSMALFQINCLPSLLLE